PAGGPARGGAGVAAPAGCDPNANDLEDGKLAALIEASVTDSANQSEIGQAALPISSGALVIQAITESNSLLPGVENLVYFVVSDPVGRPISAELSIDGLGPISPITTDMDGVGEVRFTPSTDAKSIDLTVSAKDGANRT